MRGEKKVVEMTGFDGVKVNIPVGKEFRLRGRFEDAHVMHATVDSTRIRPDGSRVTKEALESLAIQLIGQNIAGLDGWHVNNAYLEEADDGETLLMVELGNA